jgi:hypothetical protein
VATEGYEGYNNQGLPMEQRVVPGVGAAYTHSSRSGPRPPVLCLEGPRAGWGNRNYTISSRYYTSLLKVSVQQGGASWLD